MNNGKEIVIGCIADTHLKPNLFELTNHRKAFDKVINIGREHKVDILNHSGDTRVDSVASDHAQNCELDHLIKPAAKNGWHYVLADGNHDRPGASLYEVTVNTYLGKITDNDLWKNIHYFSKPGLKTLELSEGRKIQVIGLSYPPRHAFATADNIRTKAELEKDASDYISAQLKELVKLTDEKIPLLINFHGTVKSTKLRTGGEKRMPCGVDVNIPIEEFPARKNCVVCAGHIHKYQVLSNGSPLVFYPGNLVASEFDNEFDEQGMVIVRIGPDYIKSEFVPVKTIGFKTITVDMSVKNDGATINAEVLNDVTREVNEPERTNVKVIIKRKKGDKEPLDRAKIRESLEKKGFSDPKIVVEEHEEASITEADIKIKNEIGDNYVSNLKFFIDNNKNIQDTLKANNITSDEIIDIANDVERDAFKVA